MKNISALLVLIFASSAAAADEIALKHRTFICRDAFYAEMYQSRLNIDDVEGAVLLVREGGCQPVPAGVAITIVDAQRAKVVGVEVPLYDMRIPGYIPREQFD